MITHILIRNGVTIELESIHQLRHEFDIQLMRTGEIFCEGFIDTISYNMKEYTEEQVIRDFATNRLPQLMPFFGAKLYKVVPM